jgi:hypothetical protein
MTHLPPETDVVPPLQWLPCAVTETGAVDWCDFNGAPLTEPIFEQSLARALTRQAGQQSGWRTSLDAFVDAPRPDCITPTGFIFHMSRCGSTLASQMLAGSARNIVLSEADPVDAIVQHAGLAPDRHAAALRAMIETYGRNRSGAATRYFVKLDSWHAIALPLFRRAFPEVPWAFLYRDPVEVLVSQLSRPGSKTIPGELPHVFGEAAAGLAPLDYAAHFLERICESALAHTGEGGLFIDYADLPDALFTHILPHFGVRASKAERLEMAMPAMRNAKQPNTLFFGDRDEKQRAATPTIRAAAARRLDSLYAELRAASA